MSDAAGDPKRAPKAGRLLIDELANASRETGPASMTPLQMHAFLALAMARHREGRLAEAEQMYRQALRWQPDQPDAYHLLGLLAAQLNLANVVLARGSFEEATSLFARALSAAPTYVHAYEAFARAHGSVSGFTSGTTNPMGHPGLEMLEHGCFASRYRDRERLACSRPELDNIGCRCPSRPKIMIRLFAYGALFGAFTDVSRAFFGKSRAVARKQL